MVILARPAMKDGSGFWLLVCGMTAPTAGISAVLWPRGDDAFELLILSLYDSGATPGMSVL